MATTTLLETISGDVRAQGQPDEAAPARQRAPGDERGFAASGDLERAGGSGGREPRFWRRASPRSVAWELAAGATMRLPRGRAATIVRVVRGTVLVTQEDDLEDHVLEPGDEVTLQARRLAVAWAFTEAAICVRAAAR